MLIQYTNQIKLDYGVKTCLFGASGIGKTRLLSTAPEPIILSGESGLLSLRKERVAYIDISTYAKLIDAYKWVISSQEAQRFKTLGLDSLSEVAEVVLGEELRKSSDPRRAYGETQQQMYKLIRNFRDIAGKHVVMVAKEMFIEIGTSKCATPLMPSEKLQQQVPYFFDLVLHMYVGNDPTTGKRYTALHTQSNLNWIAKDRSGALDSIEYPDLNNLFKKAIA
jgi:AAA domain